MPDGEKHGIFIGNLRHDIRISILKQTLCNLLNSHDMQTPLSSITIIHKKYIVFAFVYYESKDDQECALRTLDHISNNNAGLLQPIVVPGKCLRYSEKVEKQNGNKARDPGAGIVEHDEERDVDPPPDFFISEQNPELAARQVVSHIPQGDNPRYNDRISLIQNLNQVNFETTDTYDLPMESTSSTSGLAVTESQQAEKSVDDGRTYVLGEQLGNETRQREFKLGGGQYCKKVLGEHVSKYTCAFLNSEGGTLFIGVEDGGQVTGLNIERKTEDELRIQIDQIIKGIVPAVFPKMYQVHFVPVIDDSGIFCGDLKVIEISVASASSDHLYETPDGHVYIRRDGSVQGPLKPSQIQEWTHRLVSQELLKRESELRTLQDKETVLSISIRERDEALQAEREVMQEKEKNLMFEIEIQREKQEELQTELKQQKNKKSKVCAVS